MLTAWYCFNLKPTHLSPLNALSLAPIPFHRTDSVQPSYTTHTTVEIPTIIIS